MRSEWAKRALVAFAMLALAACQTTGDPPPTLERGANGVTEIAMVEPSVELGVLTAGGVFETRADWTEKGLKAITEAFESEGKKRNLDIKTLDANGLSLEDQRAVEAARKIHRRVSAAKSYHQLVPLPTAGKTYRARMGKSTVAPLTKLTDGRYVAMLSVRDSYATGGRAAVMFAAAVLFGAPVQGGQTTGYLSLIDLNTGNITWQTNLPRHSELRTPEGARAMVNAVLDSMAPGRI